MEARLRRLEREAKLYRLLLLAAAGWVLFCGQAPSVVSYDTVKCRTLVVSEPGCNVHTTIGRDHAGNHGVMINDVDTGARRATLVVGEEASLLLGRDDSGTQVKATADKAMAMVGSVSHDGKFTAILGVREDGHPMAIVHDAEANRTALLGTLGYELSGPPKP